MKLTKLRFVPILIVISFVDTACGQKAVIFSGESENWRVQIEYVIREGETEKTGYIKYIGTEPIPNEIEYSFSPDSASGKGPLGSDGVLTLGKSVCSPCTAPSEDSDFVGTIKWDNQVERVVLTVE